VRAPTRAAICAHASFTRERTITLGGAIDPRTRPNDERRGGESRPTRETEPTPAKTKKETSARRRRRASLKKQKTNEARTQILLLKLPSQVTLHERRFPCARATFNRFHASVGSL
jgi:hypothetical protein